MTTSTCQAIGKQVMPGRQTVHYGGLNLRISPDFWLRRWLRFPFFFESTNPSFRVDVGCVSDPTPGEEWEKGENLVFRVVFADHSHTTKKFPVPQLTVGETTRIVIHNVYCAYPGQTIITFPLYAGPTLTWESLYSYHVRTEEQLWLWSVGPLIGGTVVALGALVQKWLGLL